MYSNYSSIAWRGTRSEYRPSFMEGSELDAFFPTSSNGIRSARAQHRLHNTSWYKDVKKLKDIDRKKRTLCQLNGIYLLEVWYDKNPETTILRRYINLRSVLIEDTLILINL